MINSPSVDVLIRKLGTDDQPVSRYALCVVASKRARQIIEASQANPPAGPEIIKELAVAAKEIADGKIRCVKD